LPADGVAFLDQADQGPVRVKVLFEQSEGAAASAAGFGVQPHQQAIKRGVVAGGGHGAVDGGELVRAQGAPRCFRTWRLDDAGGGVAVGCEEVVGDRSAVDRA
jgi:hypothetical protein